MKTTRNFFLNIVEKEANFWHNTFGQFLLVEISNKYCYYDRFVTVPRSRWFEGSISFIIISENHQSTIFRFLISLFRQFFFSFFLSFVCCAFCFRKCERKTNDQIEVINEKMWPGTHKTTFTFNWMVDVPLCVSVFLFHFFRHCFFCVLYRRHEQKKRVENE